MVFGGGGDRALVRVVPDDATEPRRRPIDRREARDAGPPGSGGLPRNGAIDALREGGRSEGTGRDRPSRDRLDRFSGIEADRAWQQRIGEVDGHAEQQRPGQTAHRHIACPDVPARVKTTGEGAFPRRLMSLVDNRVRITSQSHGMTEARRTVRSPSLGRHRWEAEIRALDVDEAH